MTPGTSRKRMMVIRFGMVTNRGLLVSPVYMANEAGGRKAIILFLSLTLAGR
jgi:hypothetical protein